MICIFHLIKVVEGTDWYGVGLPRENTVEPQLGYALRHIITNLLVRRDRDVVTGWLEYRKLTKREVDS